MRIARFSTGGNPRFGILEDNSNRVIVLRDDPMFAAPEPTGEILQLDEVRLLSPVIPRSKVACVGKNFVAHARELGTEAPEAPIIFLKPNTAVIGPDDPIILPKWSQEVHHEVELAVVMKTLTKDVPVGRIRDHILGYTVANDVTARDAQRFDGQWSRAKSFDTSCPLGPWIVVDPQLDLTDLELRTEVNGEVRQCASTADMITGVLEVVSYVSTCFTLLPGDVVLTGTPAGVGPIDVGDRVEVSVSGIGTLGNPVLRR